MATSHHAGHVPARVTNDRLQRELSGRHWVSRFPSATSTNELEPVFRRNVEAFIAAISAAGGAVRISATYRPRERAYLMHYSAALTRGTIAAADVPRFAGVEIEWDHGTVETSRAAARAMVSAYGIVYPPALTSRHTERRAIDMTISNVKNKKIKGASGTEVLIRQEGDLHALGATYGVNKLFGDPPHWSDDGL